MDDDNLPDQFYVATEIADIKQSASNEVINATGDTDNSDPGIALPLDAQMAHKDWRVEATLCKEVEWTLALRYAMLDYQVARFTCSITNANKRVLPPELQYCKTFNTLHTPRLYTPYFGMPAPYINSDETCSFISMQLTQGGYCLALSDIIPHLKASKFAWVIQDCKAYSVVDDMNAMRLIANMDPLPLHAFTQHAMLELDRSKSIDDMWTSMYDELGSSMAKSGIYGVMHNNGVIDTRPYDTDMKFRNPTCERDPNLRIDKAGQLRGHDSPTMHIFRGDKMISLSVSSGCLMKPLLSSHDLYGANEYPDVQWIDSLHLHDPRTYPGELSEELVRDLQSQCLRTFTATVPFATYNQPPRCIMASNMAVQAICLPRVSGSTTIRPLNHSQPVVVTPMLAKILDENKSANSPFLPGFPLMTVYCNLPDNYEDAIIISSELNERGIFSHEGFVYHPIDRKTKVPELGKKITDEYTWFRPCDEAIAISYAHTASNDRALLAELRGPNLRVGDKLATWHGQKFTISRIIPRKDMPWCRCNVTKKEFQPHVIMARSSVDNRVTPGQIWESWLAMSTVNDHKYDILKPGVRIVVADDLDPRTITNWTCELPLKGVFESGIAPTVTVAYGIAHYWQLYHLVRDKQQYMSEIPSSTSTVKGRLRGSGVRVGEMETHAMVSLGLVHCLSELTKSSDVVIVQICKSCRRLVVLCDCPISSSSPLQSTEIAVRMIVVKADIQMAIYRINGDKSYLDAVTKANPELMANVKSTRGAEDEDSYLESSYNPVQYLQAASFRYY
ncbi:hypothetical protein HDU99_006287 [Rhizoclosmatium hyalinum]|nr:hypothetical protein HDU99_006287 [Rhizoclosmatium hyalinum]